jgi:hypothetical protein
MALSLTHTLYISLQHALSLLSSLSSLGVAWEQLPTLDSSVSVFSGSCPRRLAAVSHLLRLGLVYLLQN